MKWNKKALPWVLLAIMTMVTIFLLRQRNAQTGTDKPRTKKEEPQRTDPGSAKQRERNNDPSGPRRDPSAAEQGFIRRPAQLNYSKHARCRMGCRHIDGDEVSEILASGTINVHKSDMRAQPDPRYALEGTTRDNQKIRVIVAQGPRSSTIVTVIDL
ncbi:MAG: DUF4258 domain-containing protein, partial [Dinghuibacter sp.]|nr:DUF4258 domain-containing protein [Dinghuibacter sp.]